MTETHDGVYLTPSDLAKRWQVPPSRLANWRYRGEGPVYTKVGGSVRYSEGAVAEFERAQRRRAS